MPPVLRVGVALVATTIVAHLLFYLGPGVSVTTAGDVSAGWIAMEASEPLTDAGQLLIALGCFALGRRHAGATRRWLRIAGVGALGPLILRMCFVVLSPFALGFDQLAPLSTYGGPALSLVAAIGLAGAAWPARPRIAVGPLLVWIAHQVANALLPGDVNRGRMYASFAFALVGLLATAGVAATVAVEPPIVDAAHTRRDLQRAARALWTSAGGILAVLGLETMFAKLGDLTAFYGACGAAAVLVGVLGAAWVGAALIRVTRGAVAAAPFALAGALAVGATLHLLSLLYLVYAGGLFRRPSFELDFTAPIRWGVALAVALGAVAVVRGIRSFARERGAWALAARATRQLVAVVAIAIGLATVSALKLDEGPLLTIPLCAVALGLVGRLCAAAASVASEPPGLPAARVIQD